MFKLQWSKSNINTLSTSLHLCKSSDVKNVIINLKSTLQNSRLYCQCHKLMTILLKGGGVFCKINYRSLNHVKILFPLQKHTQNCVSRHLCIFYLCRDYYSNKTAPAATLRPYSPGFPDLITSWEASPKTRALLRLFTRLSSPTVLF